MTYPAQSNFWAAEAGSAWWRHRANGQLYLCASQGRSIIRQLQRTLRDRLPFVWSYMGIAGSAATVSVDGNFGPGTFTALMRAMEDVDLPDTVRANLSADYVRCVTAGRTIDGARGQPLSLDTTAVATWFAVDSDRAWSEMSFPRDAATFRFALDAPDDGASADTWQCVPVQNVNNVMPDTPIIGTPPSDAAGAEPIPPWLIAVIAGGLYLAFGKKGRS